MRWLFIHERFGALGGAESNVYTTASELARRGLGLALVHGPGAGKSEPAWREVFPSRFGLEPGRADAVIQRALAGFNPDVIYMHKMADWEVVAGTHCHDRARSDAPGVAGGCF